MMLMTNRINFIIFTTYLKFKNQVQLRLGWLEDAINGFLLYIILYMHMRPVLYNSCLCLRYIAVLYI